MLIADSYGPVSDIELLWSIIAFVGLVFSAYNLREAFADRAELTRRGISNGRRRLANNNLQGEVARIIAQSIFLVIGVLAMFLPEVPNDLDLPWTQILIGFFVRWGLITSSIAVTYQSYLGWRIRRALKGE